MHPQPRTFWSVGFTTENTEARSGKRGVNIDVPAGDSLVIDGNLAQMILTGSTECLDQFLVPIPSILFPAPGDSQRRARLPIPRPSPLLRASVPCKLRVSRPGFEFWRRVLGQSGKPRMRWHGCEKAPWPGSFSGQRSSFSAWISGAFGEVSEDRHGAGNTSSSLGDPPEQSLEHGTCAFRKRRLPELVFARSGRTSR